MEGSFFQRPSNSSLASPFLVLCLAVLVKMSESGGLGRGGDHPSSGLSSFLPSLPGQQDQYAPVMGDDTHCWAGC